MIKHQFDLPGESGSEVRLRLRVTKPSLINAIYLQGARFKNIVRSRRFLLHSETCWGQGGPMLPGECIDIEAELLVTGTAMVTIEGNCALEREE